MKELLLLNYLYHNARIYTIHHSEIRPYKGTQPAGHADVAYLLINEERLPKMACANHP